MKTGTRPKMADASKYPVETKEFKEEFKDKIIEEKDITWEDLMAEFKLEDEFYYRFLDDEMNPKKGIIDVIDEIFTALGLNPSNHQNKAINRGKLFTEQAKFLLSDKKVLST